MVHVMAQLTFYDDKHEYWYNGERISSVSEILRFASTELYKTVNQAVLDDAKDRGTRVHKACEALDKEGTVDADSDIAGYVKAYVKFVREHKPKWELIEKPMMHPSREYAGTLDRYGTIDNCRFCVLDIKTTSRINRQTVSPQLYAYRKILTDGDAVKASGIALLSLQLKKDGTYTLSQHDDGMPIWNACMVLHRAFKKKERKKNAVKP